MGDLQWVRAAKSLGVTAVIALALVYFVTWTVTEKLDALQQTIDDHVGQTRGDQREIRYFLRQICLNTADTENERAACALELGR